MAFKIARAQPKKRPQRDLPMLTFAVSADAEREGQGDAHLVAGGGPGLVEPGSDQDLLDEELPEGPIPRVFILHRTTPQSGTDSASWSSIAAVIRSIMAIDVASGCMSGSVGGGQSVGVHMSSARQS